MDKKKIVFLFGGPGDEHQVSCWTAKSALPAFEAEFLILPVFITQNNTWVLGDDFVPAVKTWPMAEKLMSASVESGIPVEIALDTIEDKNPYLVFLGLHGRFGEDGTIQTLLEARGLVYNGSDAQASALAIDKPAVLELLQNENVNVPEFFEVSLTTRESDLEQFTQFHGFPVVVLPADSGSSVGVSLVKSDKELTPAIENARHFCDRALISKYIKGREVSCGVLVVSKTELIALPPTEIILGKGHTFWDFESKYKAGEAKEITPAQISDELKVKIQTIVKKVHRLIGADGYSRINTIIDENNDIFVLEINTLPGLTATSLIPREAQAYGLSLGQLLTTICRNIDRSAKDNISAVNE